MNRRNFMKKMLGLGVGVPAAAFTLTAGADGVDTQNPPPGSIIVQKGARGVRIDGNSLKGGNIIVEDGAEDVMVTNTLLTSQEDHL